MVSHEQLRRLQRICTDIRAKRPGALDAFERLVRELSPNDRQGVADVLRDMLHNRTNQE